MTFGQIIKKLRRQAGMTQEQLAELLSISSQAVSRWETEAAMPDISLLPPLANLFQVTTDYLLGVDIQKNEERVMEIIRNANSEACKIVPDRMKNAVKVLRNGIKLYPNNWDLKRELVIYLYIPEGTDEEYQQNLEEMNSLCEKILAECPDRKIQNLAVGYICHAAKKTANISRAQELVKSMPSMHDSKEWLTEHLLEGDDQKAYIKNMLYHLCIHIEAELYALAKNMPKDTVSLLYQKVELLNNALYENDDLIQWSPLGSSLFGWSQPFAEAEDNDMAFELLEKELARRRFITQNQPSHHFSFLSPQYMIEQMQNRSLTESKEWYRFCSEEDIQLLHSYPESFQADPRFQKIIAEFRKLQKELSE